MPEQKADGVVAHSDCPKCEGTGWDQSQDHSDGHDGGQRCDCGAPLAQSEPVESDRWYSRVTATGTWVNSDDGRPQRIVVVTEELLYDIGDQVNRTFDALEKQGWSFEHGDEAEDNAVRIEVEFITDDSQARS